MKTIALILTATLFASALFAAEEAAQEFTVTVHNDSGIGRPAETVVIPFSEVKKRLPDLLFDQVIVRDDRGTVLTSQVTALKHVHRGPPVYDDLIFQHDFATGQKRATFTVETSKTALRPFPSKVYARHVPERHDDFSWENDRVAHRAYGPALELPSAAPDQMTSSGIDLWTKRVNYPVIDRWYRKGHDGLHSDTGEGLDFYEVGTTRGVGGTGVWDGSTLSVSKNWRTAKVYANGPIRAIFELGYDAWDAGRGVKVTETKRFIVDAGTYLDEIQSTFDFKGEPLTIAIGLTEHPAKADVIHEQNDRGRWTSLWEIYRQREEGELGTGIIVSPAATFAGFARSKPAADGRAERLALIKVKPGETVRYLAGGGWNRTADFSSPTQWTAYLASYAARLAAPVRVELSEPEHRATP